VGSEALVGIVVVSHSARIAEGIVELASQMAGPDLRIVAAGGAIDGSLGTDAARVAAAITEADAGAGVVVMADLGSAVLSTRTALELLNGAGARVRISAGPIVEGTVVAAVQASIGICSTTSGGRRRGRRPGQAGDLSGRATRSVAQDAMRHGRGAAVGRSGRPSPGPSWWCFVDRRAKAGSKQPDRDRRAGWPSIAA
jgi:dihydroxyacetone kinase phosphotransfer subunit